MWCCLIIGLLVTMGFVNREQNSLLCKSLEIKINQDDEVYFLNKMDINQLIRDMGDSVVGQTKASINISDIEAGLNSHADIAKAEVYMTIDGEVECTVLAVILFP